MKSHLKFKSPEDSLEMTLGKQKNASIVVGELMFLYFPRFFTCVVRFSAPTRPVREELWGNSELIVN